MGSIRAMTAAGDFVKKDADEQSLYSLVYIAPYKGLPGVRQLCLTVHYLEYRAAIEAELRETLDRYAMNVDAEEFEDLTEVILSDLVSDDGSMSAIINVLAMIRDWASEQEMRCQIPAGHNAFLFLGRADAQDVLKFKTEEVEEGEEDD